MKRKSLLRIRGEFFSSGAYGFFGGGRGDDLDGCQVRSVGEAGGGEPVTGLKIIADEDDFGVRPDGDDVLFEDFRIVPVDEEDSVESAHGGAWDHEYVVKSHSRDGSAEWLADTELGEIGRETEGIVDAGDREKFA